MSTTSQHDEQFDVPPIDERQLFYEWLELELRNVISSDESV